MNSKSSSRLVASLFLLVAGMLGFTTLKSCRQIRALDRASDWVNQSHALFTELREIDSTYQSLAAIRLAQQATGDRALLTTFENQHQDLMENLATARALAAADPQARERFEPLEKMVLGHAERLRSQLITRGAPEPLINPHFAGSLADGAIEAALQDLLRYETDSLTRHDNAVFEERTRTETTLVTSTAIALVFLILTTFVLARDVRRQRALESRLRSLNTELEETVEHRTEDLTKTNAQLRESNLEQRWSNQALSHQLRYNLPIIERVSDAVVILTQTMHISRTNTAAQTLFESSAEELFNRSIFELMEPTAWDGHTNLPSLLESTLLEGREFSRNATAKLRRGATAKFIQVSFVPIRDNDHVVGALVILTAL